MTSARSKTHKRYARPRYESASAAFLGHLGIAQRPRSKAKGKSKGKARYRVQPLPLLQIALVAGEVALLAFVIWVAASGTFYIHTAVISGTSRVSPEDIFRASQLPGVHILWARGGKAEEAIEATVRGVRSADVHCWLPAKCNIEVVERQPKTMWQDGATLWWIDEEGVILPGQELLPDSLVVQGPLPRVADDRLHERVIDTLTELYALGIDPSTALSYDGGRGFVVTDSHGWRVVLGIGSGVAERLRAMTQVTADLEARQVTPRFVDVRFPDAPYYSVANEW